MQSLLVEEFDRAVAGFDEQDMERVLGVDIAADAHSAGSHVQIVASNTVEDFVFDGADKHHGFVQTQGKYLHTDLVGNAD